MGGEEEGGGKWASNGIGSEGLGWGVEAGFERMVGFKECALGFAF